MSELLDRAEFLQPAFQPHLLLIRKSGVPLETLRGVLFGILKDLRGELIELINNDYSAFISLSTNLVGLSAYLDSIKKPLTHVQSEISVASLSASVDLF